MCLPVTFMEYYLAKQLKEAGFPIQSGEDGSQWIENPETDLDEIYAPTLEELIEACGEKIGALNQEANQWVAYPHQLYMSDGTAGFGSTPTEAVAKLWLALN